MLAQQRALRIFISYAQPDDAFRRELDKHLEPLRKQGVIEWWHDRLIPPGANYREVYDEHLSRADIVLLLLSADYFVSDYCYAIETQQALDRHASGDAILVPVILRPVDWHDTPFGGFYALPANGKPVVDWPTQDHAWVDVVKGLRELADRSQLKALQKAPRAISGDPTKSMGKQKYRVLLCAPGHELELHRRAVMTAFRALEDWQIATINLKYFEQRENWTEFCTAQIEQSQVVLIINGMEYGESPPELGISYTHHVFREASAKNKTILVFVSQYPVSPPSDYLEPSVKLGQLRSELMRNRILDFFKSPEDLARRVIAGVQNWSLQPMGSSLERLHPLPPQPYIVHPYPLDRHFVGRLAERKTLAQWLDQGGEPLLVLEAMGGQGKTGLAWCFTQFDVLGSPLPGVGSGSLSFRFSPSASFDGFFWWSFYELNARFSEFLTEALQYTRGPKPNIQVLESRGSQDRVRELLSHLESRRLLLVLDGFERELKSYVAGYNPDQGDEPPGGDLRDARRCIDNDAIRFLIGLCGLPNLRSKVLITSRLFPSELEGADTAPLPACRHIILRDFSDEEVVELFHHSGITAQKEEIQNLAAVYGRHPLAMRLLVGVIRNDPQYPGDLRAADGYDALKKLVRKAHHILFVAFESLSKPNQQLLCSIAAFRGPVDYWAIDVAEKARASAAKDAKRSSQAIREAVKDLVSRNLLQREERRSLFDLHPIVRKYAYQRLVDKRSIHHDLGQYFASFASETEVTERSDLEPVVELYHQLIAAKERDRAMTILYDRLYTPLVDKFIDIRTALELFEALVSDRQPMQFTWNSGDLNRWFNDRFADILRSAGLVSRTLSWLDEKQNRGGNDRNVLNIDIIGLGRRDFSEFLERVAINRTLGRLSDSQKLCEGQMPYYLNMATGGFNNFDWLKTEISLLYAEYALTLACLGHVTEASRYCGLASVTMSVNAARVYRLIAQTQLLMGGFQVALAMAVQSNAINKQTSDGGFDRAEERILIESLSAVCEVFCIKTTSLGQPEVALRLQELARCLDANLKLCRTAGLGICELDTSIALGHVKAAMGDADEADVHASLALSLADRGGQRLRTVDALLILANAASDRGKIPQAKKWATQALNAAKGIHNGDIYAPGAAAAQAILAHCV